MKGSSMRAVLFVSLLLVAGPALAQDATTQVSQSPTTSSAAPAGPTHSQVVAQYPQEIAARPRAIGAGLFEAAWDGSWQFNTTQGFGEVPDVRYGITDNFEVTLLGVRYVVAEDARNVPGFAVRAQLHDLAYQDTQTPNFYPILRPGAFLEFRDRLPFHLAANALGGYEFSVQTARANDGASLQENQRISTSFAPMELELQWSPLALISFSVLGGYIQDTYTPAYEGVTQSEALLTVAAILNTNRFDVRVFYTSNWYADPRLGYVPELGAGAAIRL
jgi:hypothetical protein